MNTLPSPSQNQILPLRRKKQVNGGPSPLGRPREFDPAVALERALHVFWRRGFTGTSLTDLTQAMGINRPSLYAAFGNKRELYLKCLDHYFAVTSSYIHEGVSQPSTREVAAVVLRGVATLTTNPANPSGCMWVTGVHSCCQQDDPAMKAVKVRQRLEIVNRFKTRFDRAVTEGELPAGFDTAQLARYLFVLVTGISVNAATGATRDELLAVADNALATWPH